MPSRFLLQVYSASFNNLQPLTHIEISPFSSYQSNISFILLVPAAEYWCFKSCSVFMFYTLLAVWGFYLILKKCVLNLLDTIFTAIHKNQTHKQISFFWGATGQIKPLQSQHCPQQGFTLLQDRQLASIQKAKVLSHSSFSPSSYEQMVSISTFGYYQASLEKLP